MTRDIWVDPPPPVSIGDTVTLECHVLFEWPLIPHFLPSVTFFEGLYALNCDMNYYFKHNMLLSKCYKIWLFQSIRLIKGHSNNTWHFLSLFRYPMWHLFKGPYALKGDMNYLKHDFLLSKCYKIRLKNRSNSKKVELEKSRTRKRSNSKKVELEKGRTRKRSNSTCTST